MLKRSREEVRENRICSNKFSNDILRIEFHTEADTSMNQHVTIPCAYLYTKRGGTTSLAQS